jgi:hypothetical protein
VTLDHQDADADIGAEFVWKDGQTVLISGGLGALGLLVAGDIAARTKGSTLILLGRRTPNTEDASRIDALRRSGAGVVYRQCDVARFEDVEKVVGEYPGIQVIVHAAGLNDDGLASHKTEAGLEKVLAPKVLGIANLDRATAACPIELFVTFSSVAGALGNVGQFDYAAANGYMDAYVEDRAARVLAGRGRGRTIGINWPLWAEGAMQIDAAGRDRLARSYAIKPLPTDEGLKALRLAIASPHGQLLPLYGQKQAHAALFAPPKTVVTEAQPHAPAVALDKLQREILQEMRMSGAAPEDEAEPDQRHGRLDQLRLRLDPHLELRVSPEPRLRLESDADGDVRGIQPAAFQPVPGREPWRGDDAQTGAARFDGSGCRGEAGDARARRCRQRGFGHAICAQVPRGLPQPLPLSRRRHRGGRDELPDRGREHARRVLADAGR